MPTRRIFVAALLFLPVFAQAAPSFALSAAPTLPIKAIYKRASAGKGEGGGQFAWLSRKDRVRWFSKDIVKLWNAAEDKTAKGDLGPPGSDPISSSQDPKVVNPSVALERYPDDDHAKVVAVFNSWNNEEVVVRYDMVRENKRWKIDDVWNYDNGKPWSLKKLLAGWEG